MVKIQKVRTNFKNVSGDILDVKMRDWYGNTFFKQKINTADKTKIKLCLKTIADFTDVKMNLKEEREKNKAETKEKFKKALEEEKERVRKFLKEEE